MVLVLVLGGALTTAQLYLDYRAQLTTLDRLAHQVMQAALPPATRAVHTLDGDMSEEVVDGLLAYGFITDARIQDEMGNTLAHRQQPPLLAGRSWLASYLKPTYRHYSQQLTLPGYGNQQAGAISFSVEVHSALNGFYERSGVVILAGMLRNLLLLALLLAVFYFLLTRPLVRMLRDIQSIEPADPGRRRIAVPHAEKNDELSQLAGSANQLLGAVEEAFEQRRVVESALRESEQAIRQIIDELPAMVVLCEFGGCIEFANQNMATFFGYTREELTGLNISQLGMSFLAVGDDLGIGKLVPRGFEGFFLSANGDNHYLQAQAQPIQLQDRTLVLLVANDISGRREAEEKMAHMAYHDALTDLPNRVQLVERLEQEMVRSRRYRYYGAILFIDLDHFKTINDSLGHPVGDQLLQQVALRLSSMVRGDDVVARLSGDEFVVVLTRLDNVRETAALQAGEIAEKIRVSLGEPYPYEDMQLHVSCSIGVVLFSDEETSVHELLRFADTAMYQSKEKGRDAIEFFNTDMADRVASQLRMQGELHQALEEQQFRLYWQPRINVDDGGIEGAEALLRWQHPLRGLIEPGEFLPVLEASGLMVDVGQWVIAEGCAQVRLLVQNGLWSPGMKLSLNLSPRQFRCQTFVEEVSAVLEEAQLPEGAIDLEVTEGVVIQNIDEAIAIMQRLRGLGISFSLDDFGTGYSSISYLKRLPVSSLKIDSSFVRDIVDDNSDRILVETIITMGQLLGLQVVAEGVEDRMQLDVLRAYGCDSYQGNYFSEPVPLAEFEKLLAISAPGMMAARS